MGSPIGLKRGRRRDAIRPRKTHRQIEQLLQSLRENSFGLDAVAEEVEVTIPVYQTGFGGAVGGVGGGGGFIGGGGHGGGFM